jgi:SAM-dependent methyltransferase
LSTQLEQTYRIERAKWDAIAKQEAPQASELPSYASFAEYAASSSRLTGVADFLGDLRGKRVLEYGCGLGKCTALLAKSGARVSAFDLSPASVSIARRRAEANGLDVEFFVAAAEELPFPAESFDVAVGIAILHHLDIDRSRRELHRVLRPRGRAAFVEPLGMNPMLNFARDHVPYRQKTLRGVDRPLTYDDIREWGRGFTEVRHRETQLLGMVERLFGHDTRFRRLERLDDALLERAAFVRRYCRYVVLYLAK